MEKIIKNKNLAIGVLILILGIIFIVQSSLKRETPENAQDNTLQPKNQIEESPSVKIGDNLIPVEISQTSEEVQKGLSGRASLDENKGMLFVFEKPDKYKFWMPDMHFPIDIIWIDEDEEITEINQNASPKFDPKNPLFYIPKKPAKYVLEVNAFFAEKNKIKAGNKVIFNLGP